MKKVLVAPLDWGLGHATRCIPIIHELLARSCEVYLAGSGDSLALLKVEFPKLIAYHLPAYRPEYSESPRLFLKLLSQLPKFARVIRKEHGIVSRLVEEKNIDVVISDNRYGCWLASGASVFITHQVHIQLPQGYRWLAPLLQKVHAYMIRKFTECWIPDVSGESNLTGALGNTAGLNGQIAMRYIGPLSRFRREALQSTMKKYDVVCLFSGPEPQRSRLEELVVAQIRESGLSYLVVRGLISTSGAGAIEHSENFLSTEPLQTVLGQSDYVIARSGYSTIMDLAKLGKKVIFIPTPGQTEQEYLANRLKEMKIAFSMKQSAFDLKAAWKASRDYTGFTGYDNDAAALRLAIDHLFSSTK